MKYIDLHCDTLMRAWMYRKKDIRRLPRAMVDLERLQNGSCMVQFFAIFMPPLRLKRYLGPFFPKDEAYIEKNLRIFQNTVQLHDDMIAQAFTFSDIQKNAAANRLSGILTLEDGRAVNGNFANLERFYKMGVRLVSLTWNAPNCFGSPNSKDAQVMAQGLTPFGTEAVSRMNDLGIIVDVSHLSDGGFWDVVKQTKKPFVASHSNCRSLAPHPRNLTDEMIRAVADSGGVIGLNFGPEFLNDDSKNQKSTVERIAAHARHLINCGGIECAALGTDFDGISGQLEVSSPEQMGNLFDEMARQGIRADMIEQIAHKNVLRVIRDVIG